VLALGREELDEAESSAPDRVVTRRVLLGIGDEEGSADVLHVEGSEAARNALCFESIFIKVHAIESGVVDFDFGGAEIGDVEETLAVDVGGSHAFVDRAVRGAIVGVVYFENRIDGWRLSAHGNVGAGVPTGNGAIFRSEDENGGQTGGGALVQEEISGAAIDDDPSGSGLRARRKAGRWNDDEISSNAAGFSEDIDGIAVAVVEGRGTGIVVADPPGASGPSGSSGGAREAPGIFEVGINEDL